MDGCIYECGYMDVYMNVDIWIYGMMDVWNDGYIVYENGWMDG